MMREKEMVVLLHWLLVVTIGICVMMFVHSCDLDEIGDQLRTMNDRAVCEKAK